MLATETADEGCCFCIVCDCGVDAGIEVCPGFVQLCSPPAEVLGTAGLVQMRQRDG